MTKAELVIKIANATGVDRTTVGIVVESFMETVKDSLIDREDVFLRGFGTFTVKHRAAKTGRNISKNTTIEIPEHDTPSFKPGKEFVAEMKK